MDDKELHSLLFSSIQHHNDTFLDDLLKGEASKEFLNLPDKDGNMLLHVAVLENDLKCVECLLKHGANPNVFDTIRARTPLHLAVELGQTEIVKTILELEHVNLDIRDDRNLTCHEIAQFCDNQNLANLINSRYDDLNQIKNDFYSVVNQACVSNEPNLVRELLERYEKRIIDKLPRGWLPHKDGKHFARSSIKELINWSSSSWNDVTLLFKSASKGHTEICRLLIEYGATAKCNENTNYSPLYVAAYGGFTETVKLLLDNFPSLVREVTIEKWTILHACCLQGHSETAKLILTYPFPRELKSHFVTRTGTYEYYFAFDLNAQDAAGQTVIYLAVSANNEKLLHTLLNYTVEATVLEVSDQNISSQPVILNEAERRNHKQLVFLKSSHHNQAASIISNHPKVPQNSHEQNNQLDKIMRQLQKLDSKDDETNLDEQSSSHNKNRKYLICPFEMDTYCDYNSKTALHLAVTQQYHSIATTLLVNGSNPNLPILSRDSLKNDCNSTTIETGLNWLRTSKSTCLKEACRLNDEIMCEILIRYGASDNQDNLALQLAASNKNNSLISKFLALKSNIDPEFKINKKCNVEFASRYKQSQKPFRFNAQTNITTTFSSMFPSSPVMIDWQNLKCIRQIDPQWLIDASLVHNKRLNHPTTSLIAITRLDLSSNNLKSVHPVIFRLPSLRELNLSKNRIETLTEYTKQSSFDGDSTYKLIESHRIAMKRSKSSNMSPVNLESSNIIDLNEPQEWDLPYLEVLDLHDNRLISLPNCLFTLPKLTELDVSSNQIRQLPWSIWRAPALKEVIASKNLLDDLPRTPPQTKYNFSNALKIECSESPTDEKSSSASNISPYIDKFDNSFVSSNMSDTDKSSSLGNVMDTIETTTIQLKCQVLPLDHMNHWKKKIDLVSNNAIGYRSSDENLDEDIENQGKSKITYLNLSHNSFTNIPKSLACIAIELTRLNLSYNRITSLGDLNLYPSKLKNIDLSNNQIEKWFTLFANENDLKFCYAEGLRHDMSIGSNTCLHKSHYRLENLRSLNLGHNYLNDIQLSSCSISQSNNESNANLNHSRGSTSSRDEHQNQFLNSKKEAKESLLFPNVTALDLCFNKINNVPKHISNLKDLSVLNLNGNVSITTLPPELGLAGKLWNLGIVGCNLSGQLKTIVESKTYKTMDIIGYLRSILEEAKPYARMKLMLVGLQGIGKTSLLEQMRQEGSGSRRKAPEHWTKRMGHSTKVNLRNQRGVTLSTVGVDIHDWIFLKRTPRNQPSFGPVSFSTWDFGGQHEFYATHRYFLSRRSMYLVVWRLTDGIAGILGIQQWLVNIQSRAPGSPVIIVGTHEDMIEGGERGEIVQQLQSEVIKKFINVSDHDKCGLPRVVDSIVVSTKTKLNIKHLCNRIYDIVFSLRSPGGTERLLEQKIPATYLYLEEIVNWIVNERQQQRRDPVLTYEEYKKLASEQLKSKYHKTFRDLEPLNSREINYNSELQQATRFLHENGILLHYEDANLRDLYFLDPQWLCDILSHVVTIREINPHIKNGLMKIDDLNFLFKSIDVNLSGGIQSYVVNLLNKFEVALTWNSQYLLIPSLLPTNPEDIIDHREFQVKVVPRMRGRSAVRRYEPNRINMRASSIEPTKALGPNKSNEMMKSSLLWEEQADKTIYRMILLRYLPAGFFARLQSGILSDPIYDDICSDLHLNLLNASGGNVKVTETIGGYAGWTCWKNGIRLTLQHESTINTKNSNSPTYTLMSIQQLDTININNNSLLKQKNFKVECLQLVDSKFNQEKDDDNNKIKSKDNIFNSKWCDFDITQYSNIILITIPNWSLRITNEEDLCNSIEPSKEIIAKLVATSADHIDNLLEDWYPSLGTRFAHTLGGNYLVTRIIPCINCFTNQTNNIQRNSRADSRPVRPERINFSINSFQRDNREMREQTKKYTLNNIVNNDIYCYYVEHCILNAYNMNSNLLNTSAIRKNYSIKTSGIVNKKFTGKNLVCPKHGTIKLSNIAPDVLFEDIPDSYKIDNEKIERCKLIGRGTFGFVFKGSLCEGNNMFETNFLNQTRDSEVALKLLQPADPGPEADNSDLIAYKSAQSNWAREPFQCACKSYCTARHEITILQSIRHPNIVLFIGICIRPLAIVLELAPMGCLTDIFRNYKRAGMRIDQYSIQKSILQIAKALEFLHQQRIIYRDLKSENILVWNFPSPFATQLQAATVELKLADYGISRQALSTGIWKGFAGTINFLAPEILRHNGDEEYTEKVDCFSFGMFMYELLTLRPPVKYNEGAKNHLSDGGRPTLALRDLIYPNCFIDLMSVCWSQEPHNRPTASQIVSIASTPEFMQLLDVVRFNTLSEVVFTSALQYTQNEESYLELLLGNKELNLQMLTSDGGQWIRYEQINKIDEKINPTCSCVVDNKIWICDENMIIYILEPKISKYQDDNSVIYNVTSFNLNLKQTTTTSVRQMLFTRIFNCVIFLLENGQLWLQNLNTMKCNQLDDGSIKFECIAQLSDFDEDKFLIYCGHSNGISCFEIFNHKTLKQSILTLEGSSVDSNGEPIIEKSQTTKVTNIVASKEFLWTTAGCTIHLWNVNGKCVERKLDCSRLVPSSESLLSINIEEYYQQSKFSFVTSIVYLNDKLFIGTSFGCFLVVEAESLKPMIVFRPYERNLTVISPIILDGNSKNLITIGKGYRDVLKRFVNSLDKDKSELVDTAILWSSNYYHL